MTLKQVMQMDQLELEVWREEYRRRNLARHTQMEHDSVRRLLAKRRGR